MYAKQVVWRVGDCPQLANRWGGVRGDIFTLYQEEFTVHDDMYPSFLEKIATTGRHNNTTTKHMTSKPFEPTVIRKHIQSRSEPGLGAVSNGGNHRLTVPPAGLLGLAGLLA